MASQQDVTFKEEWVKALDGTEIYEVQFEPSQGVRTVATVIFAHGLGEHIGRYQYVFTEFAKRGIKTRGWDQRGFGKTGKKYAGSLGHNQGYPTVMADMKACAERVREEGVPLFVMGHSMGGGIALRFALTYPDMVDGIVVSAPLIRSGKSTAVGPIKYWGVRVLANLVGSTVISSPVESRLLTMDDEANKSYENDPLVHPYVSMGTARDIVRNGEIILQQDYVNLKRPILITHGEKDTICCPIASRQLVDKIPATDKTFKLLPDVLHEPHHEPHKKDEVIDTWASFIISHANGQA